MWYMIRNLRCTVTVASVLANSKTQNAFLFTVNAIFRHDYTLAVEPGSTPRPLVQKKKKTWIDSLPIDMLLSAVSVLVVAQSSSEIPEGLMNNPVFLYRLAGNLLYPYLPYIHCVSCTVYQDTWRVTISRGTVIVRPFDTCIYNLFPSTSFIPELRSTELRRHLS